MVSVNIREREIEREEKKRQKETNSQNYNTESTGKFWHIASSNWRMFPASGDICKFKLKNWEKSKQDWIE